MPEWLAPELIVLAYLLMSLSLYAVLGGADFGAGIWNFTTALQSDKQDRELVSHALGPVWEANHVWLIFVLIIMFNGFPLAFAAVSRALWLPLLLALVGIIFRGAGFVVQAYGVGATWLRNAAGAAFALASTMTPFFLGMSIGALSTGALAIGSDGSYQGNQLVDWITPLAIYSGILAVGMCAFVAAVYLTREARGANNERLLHTWRGRALASGLWVGILAVLGLVMCALEAPQLWQGLRERGWPLILLSMASGVSSLIMLRRDRFGWASILSALAIVTVLLGWGLGSYPVLVPPEITIASSKAPDVVLWSMVVCISIGGLVLFPALWWLMRIFKHHAAN